MKNSFLLVTLLLFTQSIHSQNITSFKKDNLPDSIGDHEARIIRLVNIRSTDVIVDIGAGKMKWSLNYANRYPNNQFYFEDIDSSLCNKTQMDSTIIKNEFFNVNPQNIDLVIGTENSTTLPANTIDVAILQSTLHLIWNNQLMVDDIKRILRPNGRFYIIEKFTETENSVHEECTIPYMSMDEMNQFIVAQKLYIRKEWQIIYDQGTGYEYDTNYTYRYMECVFL